MTIDQIVILGVNINPILVEDLELQIDKFIENKNQALILNVNVNCLNIAYKNSWLRSFLNKSDIVFCDGAGVMLGARLLGKTINERITYADWIWQLAEQASKKDYSIYLLGARPGIAESAAKKLIEKFPDLNIIGTHHGYFDKSIGSHENEMIIKKPFRVNNTMEDYRKFVSKLQSISKDHSDFLLGLEATGIYGENLLTFLTDRDFSVKLLNPYQIKMYREGITMKKV